MENLLFHLCYISNMSGRLKKWGALKKCSPVACVSSNTSFVLTSLSAFLILNRARLKLVYLLNTYICIYAQTYIHTHIYMYTRNTTIAVPLVEE